MVQIDFKKAPLPETHRDRANAQACDHMREPCLNSKMPLLGKCPAFAFFMAMSGALG